MIASAHLPFPLARVWAVTERAWNSPTLTTWANSGVKALGFFVILPLLFRRFETADLALWFAFTSVLGLQMMAALGCEPSFSRLYAYALGGLRPEEMKDLRNIPPLRLGATPNYAAIDELRATMRRIMLWLTLIGFGITAVAGTVIISPSLARASNSSHAWIAWGVIATTASVSLWGTCYTAFLQGTNHIPLLKRWEMLSSIGGIVTSFIVVHRGGGLLALVVSTQTWALFNVSRNALLCRRVMARFSDFRRSQPRFSKVVFEACWPSVWQMGLTQLASQGLIQTTSLVVSQLGSAVESASFLFVMRLIQFLQLFATVPFTTKLPTLAKLRAEGRLDEMLVAAKRGMQITLWCILAVVIMVDLLGNPILERLRHDSVSINLTLWKILTFTMLVERWIGMHQALYLLTNRVLALKVMLPYAFIYAVTLISSVKWVGTFAVPLAMLAAQLTTLGYTLKHSYSSISSRFLIFEKRVAIPPLMLYSLYILLALQYAPP